jgi:Fe-S oxidoreductase/nitrate reductase gamma subunit
VTSAEATRQLYWNIISHWLLYIIMVAPLVILAAGLWRRYRRWRIGGPERRPGDWWARVWTVVAESAVQRRILGDFVPGLIHVLIAWGMFALFAGTLVVMAQADFGIRVYHGWVYLALSLLLDVFGALCVVGVILAAIRRYILRPARLDNRLDDAVFLAFLFVINVSGFALEGLRLAAKPDPWYLYNPVGYAVSLLFAGGDVAGLLGWHRFIWWGHMLVSFAFIAYVPYSKALHVLVSPINQFFRKIGPPGVLSKVDFENETVESYGVSKVSDLSWKHLMDTDACTRCGRCQDNCPAHLSEKPLSPKAVIQGVKDQLDVTCRRRAEAAEGTALIGGRISEEALWSCTTCRACEQACPVFIEHIEKTVGMRRHLVMMESRFAPEVQLTFKNMETNFNPWTIGWATRADWRADLGGEIEVPLLRDHPQAEYLLWVGCSGSFDARNRKVTTALVRLLRMAGVDFAILGTEEKCCGDSARRLGNEYLFQTLAQENVEILKGYGVKKIVTACPHCQNALGAEYTQFGGEFAVVHHTQLLAELVAAGRLKAAAGGSRPAGAAGAARAAGAAGAGAATPVTYHDSCYLGRYGNLYAEPRRLITAATGRAPVEMSRHGSRSFCCGAGGGRIWMEESHGRRINVMRTEEAMKTGCDRVVTACPLCLTMLEDGVKLKNAGLVVSDVAELLLETAGPGARTGTKAGTGSKAASD